jgi:surface protein
MTIGNVDIELLEYERVDTETADGEAVVQEFHDNKPLLPAVIEKGFDYTPGDTYVDWSQDAVKWQQGENTAYTSTIWDPANISNEVDKMVFVKNTGDYSAYVRTYFAFEAGNFDTFEEFQDNIHINLNELGAWEWEWIPFLATNAEGGKYFIAKATYKKALQPDDFTDISLAQIALDSSATNADVNAFGETYEVCVNVQAIQSAGFEKPDTALDEGFGSDIPFTDLVLSRGIPLKTALHNLNGDESKPITDKVATVTFGLNKDHADKVEGYMGTLSSVEQDADVYTYYLPNVDNAANYDIYVLADSAIYTPKNSNELFMNMTALKKVDTTNLKLSRTETMASMFNNCSALVDLDVSEWDVSNVNTMNRTFYNCCSLTELAVGSWNVGNVTDMERTFSICRGLTTLAVDNWDVRKVTTFQSFLSAARANKADQGLLSINVSNWETLSLTNMQSMFYGCGYLKELDLSGLEVDKVTTMYHMFADCYRIEKINFDGWNTASLENIDGMFNDCTVLKTLDLSSFNTQKVVDMAQVFENCGLLEEIIGLNTWDTSKVNTMYEMFYRCSSLKELDLSSFDTRNVLLAAKMFAQDTNVTTRPCKLTKIYVGDNWDMSNIPETDINTDYENSSRDMFARCTSLVGGAGTAFDSAKTNKEYAIVDGKDGKPGYLTHIDSKPADPEQNQNQ